MSRPSHSLYDIHTEYIRSFCSASSCFLIYYNFDRPKWVHALSPPPCFLGCWQSLSVSPQSYLASSLGDGMNPITAAVSVPHEHALLARQRRFSPAALAKFFFLISKQRDRHPHSFLCVLQSRHPESRHGDKTRTTGQGKLGPFTVLSAYLTSFVIILLII